MISDRAAIVRDAIGFDWCTMPSIIAAVRRTAKGRRMSAHGCEMYCHRGLDELCAAALAEAKTEDGRRWARLRRRQAA